jgi:hypothetical protein
MTKVADLPDPKPIELFDISMQTRGFTLFSIKEPSVKQQQDNYDQHMKKSIVAVMKPKGQCVIL